MLKITTRTDPTEIILELEGNLAGPWVPELEGCWQETTKSERSGKVLLCAGTCIDCKGRDSVAEMHSHGAELVARGRTNQALAAARARRTSTSSSSVRAVVH